MLLVLQESPNVAREDALQPI